MPTRAASISEVNIHLRARKQDRQIIDQAAALLGENRSQFVLASAPREAKNVLLDQSTLHVHAKAFQEILAWMDGEVSPEETAGMNRLLETKAPWSRA